MGDESRFSTATATAPTASLRRHWLVTFIDVLLTSAIAVALFVLLETGLPSPTAGQTTLILCAVFSQNVVLAFWLALASAGSRWRTANVVLGLVLALWLWMAMSIVA